MNRIEIEAIGSSRMLLSQGKAPAQQSSVRQKDKSGQLDQAWTSPSLVAARSGMGCLEENFAVQTDKYLTQECQDEQHSLDGSYTYGTTSTNIDSDQQTFELRLMPFSGGSSLLESSEGENGLPSERVRENLERTTQKL